MTIEFYNTSSDPLAVNKYLTDKLTLTAQVTNVIDRDNPTFLLDLTAAKMSRNYCYVPDWGRYYFLNEPQIVNGNHIEIDGRPDDLMSHKTAILNSQIIAERSSSSYEYYMEDPLVSDSGKIVTKIRKLPTVFDTANATNNYVIILGGK